MKNDPISRQAAIDGTKKIPDLSVYAYCSFLDMLSKLPPVQERKKGRWIEVDDADNLISGKCSVCGWEAHLYEDDVVGMPYCPNCGASMMEGAEDDPEERTDT